METETFISYRGVVHPWLCDNMGHMTTRHYLAMFDDGSYHFLCSLGSIPVRDRESGLGWADVRQEIDYLREMSAGDLTLIRAWPVEIGTKSFAYMQELVNAGDGQVCARILTKTVRFNLDHRKAVEIDPVLRQAIASRLVPART